jgi:hypothetical protein
LPYEKGLIPTKITIFFQNTRSCPPIRAKTFSL